MNSIGGLPIEEARDRYKSYLLAQHRDRVINEGITELLRKTLRGMGGYSVRAESRKGERAYKLQGALTMMECQGLLNEDLVSRNAWDVKISHDLKRIEARLLEELQSDQQTLFGSPEERLREFYESHPELQASSQL
jgi:hypothetical protein